MNDIMSNLNTGVCGIKIKDEFENGCGPNIPHPLTIAIGFLAFLIITMNEVLENEFKKKKFFFLFADNGTTQVIVLEIYAVNFQCVIRYVNT